MRLPASYLATAVCMLSIGCWGNPDRRLADQYRTAGGSAGTSGAYARAGAGAQAGAQAGNSWSIAGASLCAPIGATKCDPGDAGHDYLCSDLAGASPPQWQLRPCEGAKKCIGRHCQPADASQNTCELCILDHPSDLIGYPDFGSAEAEHTEAIRQWCTKQSCSTELQADVCNAADCAYTKAVYCHDWCPSEVCGNECSRCVLAHRLGGNDILRFFLANTGEVTCAKVDEIIENWRAYVSDPCDACKEGGICYYDCNQVAN